MRWHKQLLHHLAQPNEKVADLLFPTNDDHCVTPIAKWIEAALSQKLIVFLDRGGVPVTHSRRGKQAHQDNATQTHCRRQEAQTPRGGDKLVKLFLRGHRKSPESSCFVGKADGSSHLKARSHRVQLRTRGTVDTEVIKARCCAIVPSVHCYCKSLLGVDKSS